MKDVPTKGSKASATQGLTFPYLSFGESPSFQARMYINKLALIAVWCEVPGCVSSSQRAAKLALG